jgi:hypothetical protein
MLLSYMSKAISQMVQNLCIELLMRPQIGQESLRTRMLRA